MKHLNQYKDGFITIISVAILAVATGVVVQRITQSEDYAVDSGQLHQRQQATLTAKSGIEYAQYAIRNRINDTVAGIISIQTGQAGSFTDNQSTALDICNVALENEARFDTTLPPRYISHVTIKSEGTTSDGIRPRYKITSDVHYLDADI